MMRTCPQMQAQLVERTALAEREANQTRRVAEEAQALRKRVERLEKVTVVTDDSLRMVNEALLVRVCVRACVPESRRLTQHAAVRLSRKRSSAACAGATTRRW
jgi:hypothetical protein